MKSRHNNDGHGERRATVASMVAFAAIQGHDSIQWLPKVKWHTYQYSLLGIESKRQDRLGKVSF
jgi:hypothetical protein